MQLALDTKTGLGTLMSKRQIIIEDPTYDRLATEYAQAENAKDTAQCAQVRKEILSSCFRQTIKPGQACAANTAGQANVGDYPGADNFSATLRWYPGADSLRVTAEVTDAYLSTDAPKDTPWETSCLEVFICPAGVDQTINQFFIVPEGPANAPRVKAVHTDKGDQVRATWKRTAKGYSVDVRIPWSIVRGYQKGWSVMPVEAMVNTKSPKGRVQVIMSKPGEPWRTAKGYSALEAR